MRALALGLLAGMLWLQSQAALPSMQVIALLMVAASCIATIVLFGARRWLACHFSARVLLLCFAAALFGAGWSALLARERLSDSLSPALEGRDIEVTGEVRGLPAVDDSGQRFRFVVHRATLPASVVTHEPVHVPAQISLGWYAGHGEPPPVLRSGERWQLTVRLKRPHGLANPGGFDAEAWLLNENLRATGYVRPSGNRRLAAAELSVLQPSVLIDHSRTALREKITTALSGQPYAGVIVALVIGDQRAVERQDREVFNRTGIGHLVSISGLHITMISGLIAALVHWLWRHSFFTQASLPLRLPAHKAAAAAGLLAALLYVALAGFGIPAQRTLLMLAVVCGSLWTARLLAVSQILATALFVVLLCDPWSVLWPGFWLSFGAIGGIVYASAGRAAAMRGAESSVGAQLKAAASTQWVVTLSLLPLGFAWFSQLSLVSPLANAVAIPLVSFVITPLSLLGSLMPAPVSSCLLSAAHALMAWLTQGLSLLAASPLAVWQAPQPGWGVFALAMAGMLWALAPRGWPYRWAGWFAALPMLLAEPDAPRQGFWLTAFDIGQGNALLIETAHHRLMYDSGPALSEDADSGSRVLLPYLRARGIAALDGVIVSHSDSDHSGGARSLWEGVSVGWFSSSLLDGHPLLTRSPPHQPCHAGQSWNWDGVQFELLHPLPDHWQNTAASPNSRSCTLRISYRDHSVLLTGDIEAPQERALLQRQGEALRSEILLAPHHGSGTSSTLDFLQMVNPSLALFQVGYRNRYRHPKLEVVERYRGLGIRMLRSDQSGAVRIAVDDAVKAEQYRCERARYWQSEPCVGA